MYSILWPFKLSQIIFNIFLGCRLYQHTMPSITECEERIAKFNKDADTCRSKLLELDQNDPEPSKRKEYDRIVKKLKKALDKVSEWTEKYNMYSSMTLDTKSNVTVQKDSLESIDELLDTEAVEDFSKILEEAKKQSLVEDPYDQKISNVEVLQAKKDETTVEIDFEGLGNTFEPVVPEVPVRINRLDLIKKIRTIESMLGIPITDDNSFDRKTDLMIKDLHKEISDKFNRASLGLAELSVNLYISAISGSAWFLNALLVEYYPGIQLEDTQKNLTDYKPQLMEAIIELFQDDPLIFTALKQLSNSYVKLAMYTGIALSKSIKSTTN